MRAGDKRSYFENRIMQQCSVSVDPHFDRYSDSIPDVVNNPIGSLYPWTEGGEACEIAGHRVQLTVPVPLPKALVTSTRMLSLIRTQALGVKANNVYDVLIRAITTRTVDGGEGDVTLTHTYSLSLSLSHTHTHTHT